MASHAPDPALSGNTRAAVSQRPAHIVLVGLMGAGKTTVGRALAGALGWPLRDSDADVEARTGATVRELRDDVGVERMHRLEAEALLRALDEPGPTVVAAAASTIDVAECRDRLRAPGVATVWLRAAPGTLAARFASASHRPAYGADPLEFLAAQAARRDTLFRAVASFAVDTDRQSLDRTLATILGRLGSGGEPPTSGSSIGR